MPVSLDGIAVIVLAAGRSTRMGGPNKMLVDVAGKPMVRHAVEAALQTGARPVIVVCGHGAEEVEASLSGLDVLITRNLAYAEGLSTSLKAGVAALPDTADGVVVMLGDMPLVDAGIVRRLAAAFQAEPGGLAAVPVHEGVWGNPVILARALFPEIAALSGDAGARKLLEAHRADVIEVPVGDEAVATDIDTLDALEALRQRGSGASA